jgi:hypothetical protein
VGRIDLNVNPVHIRLRNKATRKMRWMRCKEYQLHSDRVAVTIVKNGHFVSEWFPLSEWEIEKTDAPSAPPSAAMLVAEETREANAIAVAPFAATPRGTENPNAPKSLEEAIARRDDTRKAGDVKAERPGEYNAYAHLDRANPMGLDADPEKAAIQQANIKASIAAEATRQEAMRKILQAKQRRQMVGVVEHAGFGVEPG